MKNHITIILCLCAALFAVLLRSEVYEIVDRATLPSKKGLSSHQPSDPITITIHYHERRPFYMGIKGEVHGLVADPTNMIFQLADIPYIWVETPASRQLDILRENKTKTCAVGWFKNSEREKFAKFSLPLYQDKPLIGITPAENHLIYDHDNLDRVFAEGRLRLLVKKGYSYGEYIDGKIKKYKPWEVTTTGGNREMLKMLRNHRADYFFISEEEANDLLLFSGVNMSLYRIIKFEDIPKGNQRYLLCSKMVPDSVMEALNRTIMHSLRTQETR